MRYVALALRQLLLRFGWTRVAVVRQGAQCDAPLNGLDAALPPGDKTVHLVNTFYANFSESASLRNVLAQVKLVARGIYRVCFEM